MPRFLNLVYFFATDDADDKEKDKFDLRLHMPDARARRKGTAVARGPWAPEAETQALNMFATQLTGKA